MSNLYGGFKTEITTMGWVSLALILVGVILTVIFGGLMSAASKDYDKMKADEKARVETSDKLKADFRKKFSLPAPA